MNSNYQDKTKEAFLSIENGTKPITSLFEKAYTFEPFYYIKNNFDTLLTMGIRHLDEEGQKKIVSYLSNFSDEELIHQYHLCDTIEEHLPISGKNLTNIFHIAIRFGKMATTEYFGQKAKSTMPKLLLHEFEFKYSLLHMAIGSQNYAVFDYIFNHFSHDFTLKNEEKKSILDFAFLYFPPSLELLTGVYSMKEIDNSLDDLIKRCEQEKNYYHEKQALKKNYDLIQAILEKKQLNQSISQQEIKPSTINRI